jgi:hypothetical protein
LAPSFAVSATAATGFDGPDRLARVARLELGERRELELDLRLEELERLLGLLPFVLGRLRVEVRLELGFVVRFFVVCWAIPFPLDR